MNIDNNGYNEAPTMMITDNVYSTIPGQTYCLTSAEPCSVNADIEGETVTLLSIEGGQGTFIAPAKTVSLTGSGSLVHCFKGAASAVQGGGAKEHSGAERIAFVEGESPQVVMQHSVWLQLKADVKRLSIVPAAKNYAYSMQLLLAPATDMQTGWLTSIDPALPVYWPYGEPQFFAGFRYCVTLVQLPFGILANMTPLGETHTAQ